MTFRPHLSPQQAAYYHSLPKVDLHRHLEGSLRVETMREVIDWVLDSAAQASQECGIQVRLIVSINRHEPVALCEEITRLAVERRDRGIVGLDLTGNEAQFPAAPFLNIFRQAKASGLKLTVHACWPPLGPPSCLTQNARCWLAACTVY
jgi:adenosine deaminase